MNLRRGNLDLLIGHVFVSGMALVTGYLLWHRPSAGMALVFVLNLASTGMNIRTLYLRCRYPSIQEEICQKKKK